MNPSNESHADVIIFGLGAWGSAVAYHAARRGLRVLGFDQFEVPHKHGSSHGKTRGYRVGGPESEDYVPLNVRSGELYDDLSAEYGSPLLVRPGGTYVGSADYFYVEAFQRSLDRHDLPYRLLDPAEAAKEFPHISVREGEVLLFDQSSGIMFPEEIIRAHVAGALKAGAELRMNEAITGWEADGDEVTVKTARGTYHADRMVLAAGPWAPDWIGGDVPIEVERQVVAFLSPQGTPFAGAPDLPFFAIESDEYKAVYGFPDLHGDGVKTALHHGGETGRYGDLEKEVTEADLEALLAAIGDRIPSLAGAEVLKAETCWYTNSPDHLHLIGPHPAFERVIVATGCSGRGFKLAPVIGEMITELLEGTSTERHQVLALSRSGI
jgi:sarcosine oxidase